MNKMAWYSLPSSKPIGILVREKKFKIDFQDGGHGRFLIETILLIFYLQVALTFPSKFQLAFGFRRSSKYIFKLATMTAILDFQSEQF